MASRAQTRMISLLPPELSANAVDLSEAGSSEFSFPIRNAQDVLETILDAGLVVLGGDLWGLDDDGFFATGENWYVDLTASDLEAEHRRRVRSTAERFFGLHRGADDRWVTFVVK